MAMMMRITALLLHSYDDPPPTCPLKNSTIFPTRIVKVLPIPLLVTEVVHAYEAVRLMTSDVTNLNTRKKFVPAFDRCHMCARNVLEAVKLSHELSAKVPQDMLTMMIEETPPGKCRCSLNLFQLWDTTM